MAEETKPEEKPVEERRGTTSPAGVYRLGSTIDIPLTDPGEPASKDEVIQRQKDLANEIMDMLGDSQDAESVALRGRLVSGNVDELELATIKAHLVDEGHQKAREKMSDKAAERQQERDQKQAEQQAKRDEKQKEREEKQAQKRQERGEQPPAEGEPAPTPQPQAYSGNEPR